MKAKGVTKSALKYHITFEECLTNNITIRRDMRMLRSRKHELFTLTVDKCALSAQDDERHILDDGVCTRSYGHHMLN